MTEPFGPRFTFGTHEVLADGTVVHTVHVQHFAATLPADPDPDEQDERPEPIRREVGLVWQSRPLGWCASPPAADWPEAVERAERSFPDKESAAMFLYGFDACLRWQKGQAALAALPWRAPKPDPAPH